ncbi:MAG: hypothetical protein IT364_13640 [Candidatus Hydrogenedentes bacterium]|nr:hypothetical protein [Candidatus Hydrogenedentota bacterium]
MPEASDPYWRLRPQPATPSDDICSCASLTPLLLQPHLSPNPLSCARCNLEVPPERIGFDEGLANALAYWLKLYDSLYFLWLDSGEFEEWAATHFRNPSSVVNSRGIELAEKVSNHQRCYLSWFQEEGDDTWVPPTECPRCSGPLHVRFEGERPEGGSLAICEACSIAILV